MGYLITFESNLENEEEVQYLLDLIGPLTKGMPTYIHLNDTDLTKRKTELKEFGEDVIDYFANKIENDTDEILAHKLNKAKEIRATMALPDNNIKNEMLKKLKYE